MAGAVVGYFLFVWILRQGFYALILPPALMGLGAGLAAKVRSQPFSIGCAIAGLLLALFCEWKGAPFVADDSLGYFVAHLHQLRPVTLIMVALGAYFSYRFSLARR